LSVLTHPSLKRDEVAPDSRSPKLLCEYAINFDALVATTTEQKDPASAATSNLLHMNERPLTSVCVRKRAGCNASTNINERQLLEAELQRGRLRSHLTPLPWSV
jgi:hypothetical protein